jgi:hypothetical protein
MRANIYIDIFLHARESRALATRCSLKTTDCCLTSLDYAEWYGGQRVNISEKVNSKNYEVTNGGDSEFVINPVLTKGCIWDTFFLFVQNGEKYNTESWDVTLVVVTMICY